MAGARAAPIYCMVTSISILNREQRHFGACCAGSSPPSPVPCQLRRVTAAMGGAGLNRPKPGSSGIRIGSWQLLSDLPIPGCQLHHLARAGSQRRGFAASTHYRETSQRPLLDQLYEKHH